MKIRFSTGGKVRVSTRRVSASNRGGIRVRSGGLSVGKTGVRYSAKAGPARIATGATGTRAAVVSGVYPAYGGLNASGPFLGVAKRPSFAEIAKSYVS